MIIKADEALIINVTIPDCVFANVALWNRFLQTLGLLFTVHSPILVALLVYYIAWKVCDLIIHLSSMFSYCFVDVDYAHRTISLNRKQLQNMNMDGSFTVVVSPTKPAATFSPNWLGTQYVG